MNQKSKSLTVILVIAGAILLFSIKESIPTGYQKEFEKSTYFCSEKQCNSNLCSSYNLLKISYINIDCKLSEIICICSINNYDAFYDGLGNKNDLYNPSANIYKSYNDLLNFTGINPKQNPPVANVIFIEGTMQTYSKGTIKVWPRDKYGQYHELIHFLLRYQTQPQEGWYPYLEEGLAHYGAYCYNNPNTPRCDYDLGNYQDSEICIPNVGNCKGQVKDTSLVLQLRRDYNCDWNHCWKEFLNWAVTEQKGKTLNLIDATNKLNEITGKDIKPLLLSYGISESYFREIPEFKIIYDDEVIEEEIINEKGEFTTLT